LSSVAVEQHDSTEPPPAVYLIDANAYRGQVIVSVRMIDGAKSPLRNALQVSLCYSEQSNHSVNQGAAGDGVHI